MKRKFKTNSEAYCCGHKIGIAAADLLRIEVVALVYLERLDVLDEDVRPYGPHGQDTITERAAMGEFAPEFERGWFAGWRGRCGEIIDRLNDDRAARTGS